MVMVFFDGACLMCDGWVRWVIDRDPKGDITFAALQHLNVRGVDKLLTGPVPSIMVIDLTSRNVMFDAKASIHVMCQLKAPSKWVGTIFALFPSFFVDFGYKFIGKNRHLFGKKDVCELPDPSYLSRLITAQSEVDKFFVEHEISIEDLELLISRRR